MYSLYSSEKANYYTDEAWVTDLKAAALVWFMNWAPFLEEGSGLSIVFQF